MSLLYKINPQLLAKILLSFFLVISLSGIAAADSLNIRVNPLLSYKDQIREVKKECRALGFPAACEKRIQSLEHEQDRLRQHCDKRPNDFRCDALKRKKKEYVNPLEELCSKDPYHDKCVRRRENRMRHMRYMAKFCRKQPNHTRCQPKAPPRPKKPYIERYCENRGHEKRCIRYEKEKKRNSNSSSYAEKDNTF